MAIQTSVITLVRWDTSIGFPDDSSHINKQTYEGTISQYIEDVCNNDSVKKALIDNLPHGFDSITTAVQSYIDQGWQLLHFENQRDCLWGGSVLVKEIDPDKPTQQRIKNNQSIRTWIEQHCHMSVENAEQIHIGMEIGGSKSLTPVVTINFTRHENISPQRLTSTTQHFYLKPEQAAEFIKWLIS